jgi:uncharacterized protein (DUF305 family)
MTVDANTATTPLERDHDRSASERRWWSAFMPQTRAQSIVGAAAVLFLMGAVGYVIGTRDAGSADPSRTSTDVGFLYDMSAHHQQAVQLAVIEVTNGQDPEARAWALEVLRSQAYEIGLMEMRLGVWGHDPADPPTTAMAWMGMTATAATMPGMASDDELDAIREAQGDEVDALFYALMIDHHAGGVVMANHAAGNADTDWVANTAAAMARIQSDEILAMAHARDAAGLPADPVGYAPDFPDAGR